MMFNNISGGTPSTAMALLLPKHIPGVIVDTGGNYPEVWENVRRLRANHRRRVIVLGSLNKNYPTYYEYIKGEKLKPFYKSCSDKAKQQHLDYFYNTLHGKIDVNIGLLPSEEDRMKNFTRHKKIRYHFPLIEKGYTREMCEKILRKHDMIIVKTGCWFCGKQPNESWERLAQKQPELYEEAVQMGWKE